MRYSIENIKGMHPGALIKHELIKMKMSQRQFAAKIGEHWQILNAVINQKRGISLTTALKIEREFGYDEGFLLIMQVYYDIEKDKQKDIGKSLSGIPDVRRILFWDTDFDKIDWAASRESVITRILERGSDAEKAEIARYYGVPVDSLKDYAFKSSYKYNGKQN
ncbi:MAG: HigA family addiction module antidote protein [Bacteroidales bacterium]|nr:HigA family addiction module antidote protein [Bacteroidales bacterium]